MGWAALLQGDHQRARLYYSESLLVCRELGEKMIALESLEGEACVAGDEGKDERRDRLFGAAQALLGREAVAFQHTPEEGAWREPYRAPPARCFGRRRGKRRWSRVRLWNWRKQSSMPSPNRSPRQHLLVD
jgi:hypothetical protein